jgi:hypothetical protein
MPIHRTITKNPRKQARNALSGGNADITPTIKPKTNGKTKLHTSTR